MLCMINHQALANLTSLNGNLTLHHEHNSKCEISPQMPAVVTDSLNSTFVEEDDEEIAVSIKLFPSISKLLP